MPNDVRPNGVLPLMLVGCRVSLNKLFSVFCLAFDLMIGCKVVISFRGCRSVG